MSSLRSLERANAESAPVGPLLAKELQGVLNGRALWTMLLILCPLVGYSFFQAVALYSEASSTARDSPVLATGLSPLDGVLVPTLGGFYLATTLLFPFVAIRALGREKETGALRLLVQLPYQVPTLVATKMAAVTMAWMISLVPAICALVLWRVFGGHLYVPETLNLLLGHLLYALLVAALALAAASIAESSATAAIIALAVTIGSWVLDFALSGQQGLLEVLSRFSLTQALRPFEQGLLSVGLVLRIAFTIGGFATLAGIWLHPGVPLRDKLVRSVLCVFAVVILSSVAMQFRAAFDLTEDQRNSFPLADQRALSKLQDPLEVTVHLIPEDPRYTDLRRNVLDKLDRSLPRVTIRLASTGSTVLGSTSEESYGEIEYSYAGRSARSRSTSEREILPLIYSLAKVEAPATSPTADYPGYPTVANAYASLPVFLGLLPILILGSWLWVNRTPRIPLNFVENGGAP
jgi:ABC-type transport system involved in multi-copper enzyme maturation permease subunit